MNFLRNLSTRKKILLADMSILFSAMLWGGDYIVAKRALEVIPPGFMNAIKFSICALIMLLFFWKRIKKMSAGDFFVGFITGAMMFGGFIGQTTGLKYTTVGNNAFITSAYVIVVPFMAWVLTRERPKTNSFVAVLLTVLGIGFLTLQGSFSISKGDGITLIGAVFFGMELALLGKYAKKMDVLILAFLEAAVAGILFWIYAFSFETVPVIWSRDLILSMAYITFFGSVITHVTVTVALKYTTSSRGAVLCATEALFAVFLAAIFLGERLYLKGWIGSALVLLAVLVAELGGSLFRGKSSHSQ